MSDVERQIHDYLDGRLAPEARRAFEERVAADPGLARRLVELETIGKALREPVPELSGGFYAEARSRFEQRHGDRAWGFRLLSWEGAGIAAAAVLIAALFVPRMLQNGEIPTDRPLPRAVSAPILEEPERQVASAPTALPEGDERDAARLDGPAESVTGFVDDAEAGQPLPTPKRATAGRRETDAVGRDVAPSSRPDDSFERDEIAAVEEKITAGSEMRAPTPGDRQRRTAALADVDVASEAGKAERKGGFEGGRVFAVAVSATLLEGELLRVVDRPSVWRALLQTPGGASIEALGAPDSRRLVLVRDTDGPIDCDGIVVETSAAEWVLRLAPPAPGSGSAACALALPPDGRPVRVLETRQ